MTMKGEPVPPEGLDHIKSLQQWLETAPQRCLGTFETGRNS